MQKSGLSKGCTDWHQIWYTSADSSGNGYRLNTICPSTFGGLGGHKFKSREDSNGWSDWHQIWYTCVDSSVNGYTPNKLPRETQGGTWGVLGGHTFKGQGKLSNGWTDWHQLWFTSADSSGNGHSLYTSRPSIPQGAFRGRLGGHKFISLEKLSKGWTDWHQMCTPMWIHLGMDIVQKQFAPQYPGAAFWVVLWDQQFKRL